MSKDKKAPGKRSDRFSLEWQYAKACHSALQYGTPVPEAPRFTTWQLDEHTSKWTVLKTEPITPMTVTHNGTTLFG